MELAKSSEKWPAWMWTGIVLLGAMARLIPHPWNFTPLVAMGLFAGTYARRMSAAAAATLFSLVLGDLILGLAVYHRFTLDFSFVYPAALVPVLLGRLARGRKRPVEIGTAALASSISFFAITNFGSWLITGLYPRTLAGLATCYAAGIPFYRNQLLGDLFYTLLMFGSYELLARRWRLARAAA